MRGPPGVKDCAGPCPRILGSSDWRVTSTLQASLSKKNVYPSMAIFILLVKITS